MKKSSQETPHNQEIAPRPHEVRLPGFILDEEIGLGDAIKKLTYMMGIKPCSGCERRATTLNNWMTFSPRR